VELRVFPRLRFHWDPTPERAETIDRLIQSLHEEAGPAGATTSAGGQEGGQGGE
jgi:ribosome-binding factor A